MCSSTRHTHIHIPRHRRAHTTTKQMRLKIHVDFNATRLFALSKQFRSLLCRFVCMSIRACVCVCAGWYACNYASVCSFFHTWLFKIFSTRSFKHVSFARFHFHLISVSFAFTACAPAYNWILFLAFFPLTLTFSYFLSVCPFNFRQRLCLCTFMIFLSLFCRSLLLITFTA